MGNFRIFNLILQLLLYWNPLSSPFTCLNSPTLTTLVMLKNEDPGLGNFGAKTSFLQLQIGDF